MIVCGCAGCVGLAVISGAASRKASKIIAIDTNNDKKKWADEMGATDFVNPKELQGQSIVEKLVEMTDGGLDYTLCVPFTAQCLTSLR